MDVVKAGVIIALAGLGIVDAFRLSDRVKTGSGLPEVVGPDLYLKVISSALMACGLLLLASGLVGRRRGGEKSASWETGRTAQVGSVVIVYLMYLFAVPILGYLLSSVLFFAVVFCLFGYRPWLKGVLLGLGMAVASYYFFVHLISVALPKGWLGLPF